MMEQKSDSISPAADSYKKPKRTKCKATSNWAVQGISEKVWHKDSGAVGTNGFEESKQIPLKSTTNWKINDFNEKPERAYDSEDNSITNPSDEPKPKKLMITSNWVINDVDKNDDSVVTCRDSQDETERLPLQIASNWVVSDIENNRQQKQKDSYKRPRRNKSQILSNWSITEMHLKNPGEHPALWHTAFVRHYGWSPSLEQVSESNVEEPQEFKSPQLGRYIMKGARLDCGDHLIPSRPLHEASCKLNRLIFQSFFDESRLNRFQREAYAAFSSYRDFVSCERTFENAPDYRLAYTLHAVEHVLHSAHRVQYHDRLLKRIAKGRVHDDQLRKNNPVFRDQGFFRPKVLIVVPFRNSAWLIFKTILKIFKRANYKIEDFFFAEKCYETTFEWKVPRPPEYYQFFEGNILDTLCTGIVMDTRKRIRFTLDVYESDIVIVTPLYLRKIVQIEKKLTGFHDRNFLASVDLLIMDQADVYFMQNWDHIVMAMESLHKMPARAPTCDTMRIRPYSLEGLDRFMRQTIILSHVQHPAINALISKHCKNFAGSITVSNPVARPSMAAVCVSVPQVFHRFECESAAEVCDRRFEYFVREVLPEILKEENSHTLIYIRSYFDFVRIRNYFRENSHSCAQICEYASLKLSGKSRDMFYHGVRPILLYSERYHFHFRPVALKGMRNLFFYELPTYPQFYSELCNMLRFDLQHSLPEGAQTKFSCLTLFCKYDALALKAVVGEARTAFLISKPQRLHAFIPNS